MLEDSESFALALSELRFDDAATLVESLSDPEKAQLAQEIDQNRRQAIQSAQQLASSIDALARQHQHLPLIDIDEQALTARRLNLLPAAIRERAETHLRGARHWASGQLEANRRRLDEARRALDEFDLGLARSIVRRVEDRFLDEHERERRDELLLDISARTMETEELSEVAGEIWQESQPTPKSWWRRKRPR